MHNKDEMIEKVKYIDWEFADSDTQYLTHNIHRYSGKYIPQIARMVIELFTEKGDTVFDPYLGSGTTALEAILLDRKSKGVDLNPLAILVSEVKTTAIDRNILLEFQKDLLSSLEHLTSNQIALFRGPYKNHLSTPEESERFTDEWNRKWYQEHVLKQLIMIYDIIEDIEDETFKKIGQVAFSDILRKSSNASSKYPNVMYDKNHKEKPLPINNFIKSFNDTIDKLLSLSDKIGNRTVSNTIKLCNNTELDMEDESVDAIVTHPPYIASVPYAEYCCLSLEWLGHSSKMLDSEITGGKRHRKDVVDRFEKDYDLMLSEAFRVLKKGKYAFFMVGNPTSHGKVVDLHEMTVRLAKNKGFEYIYTATRVGSNRRGNNMGVEYLEFFRKP